MKYPPTHTMKNLRTIYTLTMKNLRTYFLDLTYLFITSLHHLPTFFVLG